MEQKFYKCDHCGNILIPLVDAGVTPFCCGEVMQILKPGTEAASAEKHTPVIERNSDGKHIKVSVSSAPHPMTDEHYIEFIVLKFNNRVGAAILHPGDEPNAEYIIDDNSVPIKAYEYCNLHGLWESEI